MMTAAETLEENPQAIETGAAILETAQQASAQNQTVTKQSKRQQKQEKDDEK